MRRAAAGVLVLVLAFAAGCGSDSSKQDAAAAARARAAAARQAKLVAAGRPVFAKHCASCHTIEGRVAHPTFVESPIPNLDEVKPEARYIADRIETGGFDMPSLEHEMSAAQRRAVIAYVATIGGRDVPPSSTPAPSALALGRAVFQEHCRRCHAIAGGANTGRPTYTGTDFDKVEPSEQLVIKQVLRGIREEMPSFRGKLSDAQIHAVAAYVNATAGR